MSPLEQVAVAWQSLLRTLAAARRPALWVPLAPLVAAQAVTIVLLWWFAHPFVSWFMAPLIHRAAGAAALRYPDSFRALPALYGRADGVLAVFVGAFALGAATVAFAAHFRGGRAEAADGMRVALRRAPALILANLPATALAAGLPWAIGILLAHRSSGGLVQKLAYLFSLSASLVVQALFFFVTALVVIEGRSLLGAFLELPRTWARGFWAALFLGVVLLLPLLPMQFLWDRADLIVDRGIPELTGWLVVAQAALSLVLWFLLAGSSTLAYLTLVRDEDSP